MKFVSYHHRYPCPWIRTSLTYQDHLIYFVKIRCFRCQLVVPEERKTIVYQNKVLLLLWGNKSFCIYYRVIVKHQIIQLLTVN